MQNVFKRHKREKLFLAVAEETGMVSIIIKGWETSSRTDRLLLISQITHITQCSQWGYPSYRSFWHCRFSASQGASAAQSLFVEYRFLWNTNWSLFVGLLWFNHHYMPSVVYFLMLLQQACLSFAGTFSPFHHVQYPAPQNSPAWNTTLDLQTCDKEESLHHIAWVFGIRLNLGKASSEVNSFASFSYFGVEVVKVFILPLLL